MQLLVVVLLLLSSKTFCNGQYSFAFGPSYSMGMSTFLGSTTTMHGMGASGMQSGVTGVTPSIGVGLKAESYFTTNWGIFAQTGFQQRGAPFNENLNGYKPSYRLNYWDLSIGGSFRTAHSSVDPHFNFVAGLTQHTLLKGSRMYETGTDDITNEFSAFDIGLILGLGANFPVSSKDKVQVMLFSNIGFVQNFSNTFRLNGMGGRNFLTGIQFVYLIGTTE